VEAGLAVLAEVEAPEPAVSLLVAVGDPVEVVLHAGREVVVHQTVEMLLEQLDDRERQEGRHERRALLEDVAPVLDRADDRRVGRGPPDAPLLERPHERRLRVAWRRGRRVAFRLERRRGEVVAFMERRQAPLAVVLGGVLVAALLVGGEEASERDHGSRGAELGVLAARGAGAEPDGHRLAAGVGHLRGERPLPDQVVERELVAVQLAGHIVGSAEPVPGRPDRLVRLLRVLHLAVPAARLGRHGLLPEELACLVAGGGQRRLGERRRVGAHVRDVAPLVQPLRDAHRGLCRHAQLAARLLLQRGRHERRRGAARVWLALDAPDSEGCAVEALGEPARGALVQGAHVAGAQPAVLSEVAAGRDTRPVERHEPGLERPRVERAEYVPVRGGDERHAGALALDDQARGDGLHAAGGEPAGDLLPQDGGDLVAVEAVEDPARLLRVDEPLVDVACLVERALDCALGDLVEHHASRGDLGLEHLEQVPGDRFPFAVLVGGEQQLVGVLELAAQIRDDLLLVRVHDVVGLEVVLDVDRQTAPRLALDLLGDLGGALGQVADVPDARLHDEARAEIARDRLGLGGGFHDDQPFHRATP
jgi:hypothetical protein